MASVTVKMKSGAVREFPQLGRPGGSYTNTVKYVEGFVVVTDEYGEKTSLPTADVAEVIERPDSRRW